MGVRVGPPGTHARTPHPSSSGSAPGPRPALTSSLHHLVELALDVQLRVLRLHTLELDGNFFTRRNVGTCQGGGGAQGTWVTLSQGQLGCLPLSSSAPLGGGQKGGKGPSTASKGNGRAVGRADTRPSLGGRGEGEEQHVRGEGQEQLRTSHGVTGWCSEKARREGNWDGLQRAHRSCERNCIQESGSHQAGEE